MTKSVDLKRITEITRQIDKLPKGYISKKVVGGNVYYYHQWSENGEKKSKYLRGDEIAKITEKIELRKQLQKELQNIKNGNTDTMQYKTTFLRCTLMHKQIPVVEIELDNETGFIQRIIKVFESKHLPIGVGIKGEIVNRVALNAWWTDRSIPASRSGVRDALDTLEIRDTKMLLIRCFGLSLSDQYWICPNGSELKWEDINFFKNDFSEDIGDILFGAERKKDPLDFSSPDSTSDGNLKKRWKIIDGERCLIKGGSNPYRQQPLNEVISTIIMQRLGIPCVSYKLVWNKNAPYSICKDFVDKNTELVTAWRIIQTKKQPNNKSLYQHFLDCADELGIPNVREFLDKMIVLDYIIENEDRHLNNFGAIRDAHTLQWLGMAPIYDSGSSLCYDKSVAMMRERTEVICKPFKRHHIEQLKLVSSFDWIDFAALSDIRKVIIEVLSDTKAKDYMEENRIQIIASRVEKHIKELEMIAKSKVHKQVINNEDEVRKNIAASYIELI